ncbi:hypothetical protein SAMN05421664_1129 [Chryseobacterium soldanellicola]|uniref:Uncharacterized protein n=1 Tax=Chryseobacterium soldanellicola TaxID=311333 RepID=A0A1H0ZYJ1_9FLAO|nr:hypothetical protein [Chryseobacterium soldanellicola]SDQ32086.1 hypothetical protein SAMN05421664_1129 [Chryseobacterium soldanellicola]
MKTLLKILFISNLFFIYDCKAQTTSDYITFYNGVVPQLNSIVPNKTQFYGQNFSNFYNELLTKHIDIVMLNYDTKTDPGAKYYILRLFFANTNMWSISTDNTYQFPSIAITFENEIPSQIKNMVEESGSKWNSTLAQFFANMKIEKIKFIGVNGYNSPDRSLK